MRIYFEQGHPALALKQYKRCREALRQEIGEDPEVETQLLYREIRQRRFSLLRARVPLSAAQTAAGITVMELTAGRADSGAALKRAEANFKDRGDELFDVQDRMAAQATALAKTRLGTRNPVTAEGRTNFECWALMSQVWREIVSYTPLMPRWS
jgi:hypothetical protein